MHPGWRTTPRTVIRMDLVAWSAEEAKVRLLVIGNRWAHTQGVVARAQALAQTVSPADREVLLAAAYVHDIGYAPDVRDTGFHPLDGARWLRLRGQERLARLVAHHSGAAFEAETRGLAAALADFAEERSAVADVLTYCDLTTDPDGLEVAPVGAVGRDRESLRRRQRRCSRKAGRGACACGTHRAHRRPDRASSHSGVALADPRSRASATCAGTFRRRQDVLKVSSQAVETSRRLPQPSSRSKNYRRGGDGQCVYRSIQAG